MIRDRARRLRRLDLQAKIILVLIAVILPTFVFVTIVENQLTKPLLEEEMRQLGITTAKNLSAEIVSQRLLALPNPSPAIERYVQELIYAQPNVNRIDVFVRDPITTLVKSIASNIEEEPGSPGSPTPVIVDAVTSQYHDDENAGFGSWEIHVPIEQRTRDQRNPKKVLGTIRVEVSVRVVHRITNTLWKITATGAAFSVFTLVFALNFFLRRTIANDRLLRQAESQNLELTEQLHEAHRQLMNFEKLAVMGQLTASFAHEIGTPLNAVGGHLQLLKEELPRDLSHGERFKVIEGQLTKIEKIVKGFLQSTAKPTSQRQLVDLNRLVDHTLGIVKPRADSIGVELRRDLSSDLAPVRAVPLDLEQVLLNLVSNSLDSLKAKKDEAGAKGRFQIEVSTRIDEKDSAQWALISVYDTGEGIKKADIPKVLKPFFTTKRPGEGTGLGLTISEELAKKYGGVLEVESREGAWTRVTLRIPYQVTSA